MFRVENQMEYIILSLTYYIPLSWIAYNFLKIELENKIW